MKSNEDNLETVLISQPFAAKIKRNVNDGRNSIVVNSKDYYQHQLNKFKDGEKVILTVSNKKLKRTQQQNRYYWGVYLPLISSETGESNLDRLHILFKGKFLTKEIVEVLGEKVRVTKSTTQLGIGDFCEYILAIQNETGIEAPPTKNFDLLSLDEMMEKSSK